MLQVLVEAVLGSKERSRCLVDPHKILVVCEELGGGGEGGTARPGAFDLLLHAVGVLCNKEEAQVDNGTKNTELAPSPPHLVNDAAVIKRNGVDGEVNEGDTVEGYHPVGKDGELLYGSSVEAQVLGPTVDFFLNRS